MTSWLMVVIPGASLVYLSEPQQGYRMIRRVVMPMYEGTASVDAMLHLSDASMVTNI
jgi:hypothetical protein